MSQPEVVIHPTPDLLAAATAARLITTLVDIQATGRIPASRADRRWGRHQTAGAGEGVRRPGRRRLVAVSRSSGATSVSSRLPIPERNEKQAREALLDHVPVDPARVHAMAASDGEFGDDVDAAAAAYADIIDGRDGLDLIMLGMGDEGHVASIFPESPAVYDTRSVVPVRDCPKPPPTRVSLTLPTIRQAAEVWIITAAASKAGAVALALGGADEVDLPAAGATGRSRTRWLLDPQSASELAARS